MALILKGGGENGEDIVLKSPACGFWECKCCPQGSDECSKCGCKKSPCSSCKPQVCPDCAKAQAEYEKAKEEKRRAEERAKAKERYERHQREGREYEKKWAEERKNDGKTTFSERIKDYRQSTNIEDRRNMSFEDLDKSLGPDFDWSVPNVDFWRRGLP